MALQVRAPVGARVVAGGTAGEMAGAKVTLVREQWFRVVSDGEHAVLRCPGL